VPLIEDHFDEIEFKRLTSSSLQNGYEVIHPIFGIKSNKPSGDLLYKEVTVTVELNDVEPDRYEALF